MDSQSPMSVRSHLWFIVLTCEKIFSPRNWILFDMENIRGMPVYDVRSLLIKNHMHRTFASLLPSQLLLWKFNTDISLFDEDYNIQTELKSIQLDCSKPVEAKDKVTLLELYHIISPEMFQNIGKNCIHGIIQIIPSDRFPRSEPGSIGMSFMTPRHLKLKNNQELL
jgi:hypothetical protein